MLTNEEIVALGFTTRGLYQGPLALELAVGLLQSLAISRHKPTPSDPHSDPLGELIFGRLVIVAQENGFNIVEIVDNP